MIKDSTSYHDFRDYLGQDQILVLQYLLERNNLSGSLISGRINIEKITSIGQSTGLLSSKGACLSDTLIKKCVSLDAQLGNENELKALHQDFLLFALERAKLKDDFNLKQNVVELVYQDAGHFSVADWDYLQAWSEKKADDSSQLLADYARNINLFICEDNLSTLVKKIQPFPRLKIKSYVIR